MSKVKGEQGKPPLLGLFGSVPPACPAAPPKRPTRAQRAQSQRGKKAGALILARYGPEHYRRMQALSAAAQAQRIKEPPVPYSVTRLSRVGFATLQRIAAETGLSQSAILREAWEAQLRAWAERNPPK